MFHDLERIVRDRGPWSSSGTCFCGREAYTRLDAVERRKLLAFLNSL